MKNLILFLFSLMIVFSGFSQENLLEYTHVTPSEKLREMQPLNLTGSIYLNNEFSKGKIFDSEKAEYRDAWLRYNVLDEIVEIKLNLQGKAIVLPKLPHLEYQFEDYTLKFKSLEMASGDKIEGYFMVYLKNPEILFFAKPQLKAQRVENDYSDPEVNIEADYTYYIKKNKEIIEVTFRNKTFKELFRNDQKAQFFLKGNKIKTSEDVIRFLEYYSG